MPKRETLASVKKRLMERCATLEHHVRDRTLASDDELAEYRPEAGRRAPIDAWQFFYANLVRFCGRLETKEYSGAEADATILDALRAIPEELTLSAGQQVRVYAKSFETLLHLHARDRVAGWLAVRYAVLRESDAADDVDLLERVAQEIAAQTQMIAWGVITEGPHLPYPTDNPPDSAGTPAPAVDIPEFVRALEPFDVLRIHQAFVRVNSGRLEALERLLTPPQTGNGKLRPSWSLFLGSMALKMRVDVRELARNVPLVSLLATSRLGSAVNEPDSPAEGA